MHGYLETPKEKLPHWSLFNHNITSEEPDIDKLLETLKPYRKKEFFDLRPYMIEEPVKLDRYAYLGEALKLFRHHHMRHLLVVCPKDGSLIGIVTRKDLDAFMKY